MKHFAAVDASADSIIVNISPLITLSQGDTRDMGVIFDNQIHLLIQRNRRPEIVNVNNMAIYGAISMRTVIGIMFIVIING